MREHQGRVIDTPHDPIKDFAPVALPVASAIALVVHPSVPAKTLAELVALIRANPGKYSYASGGAGAQPHLAFEQFRMSLGLDVVYVPFTGAGPTIAALVANQVPIGISSLPPAMPKIKEGSLRALALTSKSRSRKLPDIPTASEAGYLILEGDQWSLSARLNAGGDHRHTPSQDCRVRCAAGHERASGVA